MWRWMATYTFIHTSYAIHTRSRSHSTKQQQRWAHTFRLHILCHILILWNGVNSERKGTYTQLNIFGFVCRMSCHTLDSFTFLSLSFSPSLRLSILAASIYWLHTNWMWCNFQLFRYLNADWPYGERAIVYRRLPWWRRLQMNKHSALRAKQMDGGIFTIYLVDCTTHSLTTPAQAVGVCAYVIVSICIYWANKRISSDFISNQSLSLSLSLVCLHLDWCFLCVHQTKHVDVSHMTMCPLDRCPIEYNRSV